MRSGCRKSLTADPSLRNSGLDTYVSPLFPSSLNRRSIAAPVPTGTVLFMTSACSDEAGSSSTTALTRERSASPE
jgi:hypothetical protein